MTLSMQKVGSLFVAGVVGVIGATSDASAVNINTHATACSALSGFGVDQNIQQRFGGISNYDPTHFNDVVCPVVRSPLASGATTAKFYVDGRNFGGASTSCNLYSLNYDGTFLASTYFSSKAASYDQLLSLTAANAPTYAYLSLDCYLPPNANAELLGVTSVQ